MPTQNRDLTVDAVTDRITGVGLLPVIVVDDLAQGRPLARALVDSGLHTAEVTFRTPQAFEALSVFAGHPELLVGAGTVRTAEQVRRARDAGARFVVSPGFSEPVVEACRALEVPVFPGVSSATDIHRATEASLAVLKFFPAEASGGPAAIAALAAPFPDVRFIPTGGVGPRNLADYVSLSAVCCVGGSWMVPGDAMRAGDWRRVTELCRNAVAQIAHLRSRGS
jgi:2-dehydro-3-deoxyphosphogluconate aldolase / (4S)-4-hydroxy-2-oxoglutarate aldolase